MPCVENDVICCTTCSSLRCSENVGGVNEREDNERNWRAHFSAQCWHMIITKKLMCAVLLPIKASRWNLCMTEYPRDCVSVMSPNFLTFSNVKGWYQRNLLLDSTSKIPDIGKRVLPTMSQSVRVLSNLYFIYASYFHSTVYFVEIYDNRTHPWHVWPHRSEICVCIAFCEM